MKVLISADMEGATGVTWSADVEPGTEPWQRCRSMFTSDVNGAIAGLFDGGATEVVVNEAHATMRNLLLEELDERATMITGRHKALTMVEGIQAGDVDGVVFLGYHAGAGAEGVLAHTYLPNSITGVWLDGAPASEGRLNALVAAQYGTPVILVTGDDRTCADAATYAPEAHTVAVKEYVSRYAARCKPPARTFADIRAGAKAATASAVRHEPATDAGPFTVEVEVDATQLADFAGMVPTVERVAERRVRYTAGTAEDMIRCFKTVTTLISNGIETAMADRPSDVTTLASDLIRIDTTNSGDGTCRERPAAEYVAERLDDVGIEATVIESAPGRANVVARIDGTEPDRDAVLVHGHLDVVPAEPADWQVHPFSGEVRDGVLWGRGAVDMKGMDAMMLAVVRAWMREGRRPRRDVVLAFTADEEASAAYGSDFLVREHADLFEGCTEGFSESGAYTFHAGDGIRLYPVGAGERGTAWMRLTANGQAGHGSKVNTDNAVGALAAALARFDQHEWPVRLTPTVRAAVEGIGTALGIEVDTDDPAFDADEVLAQFGPARQLVESTLRNSTNPTMMQAGYKVNVIPQTAVGYVDGRVLPGMKDEFESTVSELAGPRVHWDYEHTEVPLSADVDSSTFAAMADALTAEDPGAYVVPMCMSGGTDAKQFSRLGIVGYGFSPLQLPPGFDYQALFHGIDERVPVGALDFGVRVLDRFLTTVG